MIYIKHWLILMIGAVLLSTLPGQLEAQGRGMECCRGNGGGMRGSPTHQADMATFHFLLDHRDQIRRQVIPLPNGVETLTESDDPAITAKLQEHVQAMSRRVKEQRPIHRRDPLFAEIFKHGDQIDMKMEKTDKGMRVTETADDPYVVQLIQAHAEVVTLFLANGHAEMRKNHPVPILE